jgi:hypothetical protein
VVPIRFAPGERVPIAGPYRLVGHYGEATTYIAPFREGDLFPFIDGDPAFGPYWFERVYEANENVRAA